MMLNLKLVILLWLAMINLYASGPVPDNQTATVILQPSYKKQLDLYFKRDNFVVLFWPHGYTGDMDYIELLLTTFSKRFRTMSISETYTKANIFSVIAKISNKQPNTENNIRIYSKCALGYSFDTRLSSLLTEAEQANDIVPGIVTHVILTHFGTQYSDYDDSIKSVRKAFDVTSKMKHSYRLSLELSISDCKDTLRVLFEQTSKISMYVFVIPFEPFHFNGLEESVRRVKSDILRCKVYTNKYDTTKSIGFSTSWPDSNDFSGLRNRSALIRYWEEIAVIGISENVTIFMDQFFDMELNSTGMMQSNGWWTRDLIEKLQELESTRLPPNISDLCTLRVPKFTLIRNNDNNIQLMNKFVSALIDPEVETELMGEDMISLVNIVKDRFRNVILSVKPDDILYWNKNFRLFDAVTLLNQKISECPTSDQISASLILDFDPQHNEKANDILMKAISLRAEDANNEYEGTLSNIILRIQPQTAVTSRAGDILKYKAMLNEKQLSLSLLFNSQDFEEVIRSGVKNISDFLLLQYNPCNDNRLKALVTPGQSLSKLLTHIKSEHSRMTKQYLEISNPTQKPGILVHFSDTDCIAVDRPQVFKFWLELTQHCRQENIEPVISPTIGFDDEDSLAWWHVRRTQSGYNVSEYIEPEYNQHKNDAETKSVSTLWFYLAAISLIFVCSIAIFWFLRSRRVKTTDQKFKRLASEFRYGLQETTKPSDATNYECILSNAYDSSYEIPMQWFELDTTRKLGSGEFGCVSLAKIVKPDADEVIWTAAKSVHSDEAKRESSLRSLLAEIKLLSHLGSHDNIIKLLGAYTADVGSGKAIAFLELCQLGSLQDYLRRTKGNSTNAHLESNYLCMNEEATATPELLMKWSIEIATGMDYISSKYIVHADLATRNILLDGNKTAKICDFGLSRRMENYRNYVKASSEPLPWRWMAFESLTYLEFSTKSDVWSFGITMWEIFNEGKIPYQGLQWTLDFSEKLESGMRPPQPRSTSSQIYALMNSCWNIEPDDRPNFSSILHNLKNTMAWGDESVSGEPKDSGSQHNSPDPNLQQRYTHTPRRGVNETST